MRQQADKHHRVRVQDVLSVPLVARYPPLLAHRDQVLAQPDPLLVGEKRGLDEILAHGLGGGTGRQFHQAANHVHGLLVAHATVIVGTAI